jgi:hypothetical protein
MEMTSVPTYVPPARRSWSAVAAIGRATPRLLARRAIGIAPPHPVVLQ